MLNLAAFFSSAGFAPHGFCLMWRPDIVALHAISDLVIAAAYFSIPLAIITFVRRRTDLIPEHRRIAMLFSLFQTLSLSQINPKLWLTAYLNACAAAGGKVPEDADRYLPWNLSDEQKRLWSSDPKGTGTEPSETDTS